MSEHKLRVGLCQLTSTTSPEHNLSLIRDWAARAAEAGARVAVFPEAAMARFGVPLASVAEPADGPWATAVAEIADQHHILIAAGMFTPHEGRVRNTILLTGLGHHTGYHKIHLYDAFDFRESDSVAPGNRFVTVTVDGMTLGVATCYDVRFPALFQRLASDGATAVMLPASWGAGPGKAEQWELLVRARALDSGTWILACDQAPPENHDNEHGRNIPTGIGQSMVAAPWGEVSTRLNAAPQLLITDIDPAAAIETQERTGSIRNRVPQLF
ncbi:carbon-nitrogen hydrolase family protein [Mycobacteroides sp. LB1]|uniref:carbon-nitrogen hydrolase family protein n=1 Tax=Mycobacteroides sp. LB1 TaxID=2750814 RepID=UPI0015E03EB7|nr:carbon-nitrogen hydrolase family protein [Mycobacteroides sp. LB1]